MIQGKGLSVIVVIVLFMTVYLHQTQGYGPYGHLSLSQSRKRNTVDDKATNLMAKIHVLGKVLSGGVNQVANFSKMYTGNVTQGNPDSYVFHYTEKANKVSTWLLS